MTTMLDVARMSGFSRFTVSKVLNGTARVTETARTRVMEACRKLNFVPNKHASSLAKGSSGLVGIIVTSIMDPFYGEIIETAEQTAHALGFDLAYRCSYGDPEQERRTAQVFLGLKAASLIVSAVPCPDNKALWESIAATIPIVFIDHAVLRSCHLVTTNHRAGATLMAE